MAPNFASAARCAFSELWSVRTASRTQTTLSTFNLKDSKDCPEPTCADLCRFVPSCADLCRLMPTCFDLCRLMPSCADLSRLMPFCADLSRLVPTCADLCRLVPTCAERLRKFELIIRVLRAGRISSESRASRVNVLLPELPSLPTSKAWLRIAITTLDLFEERRSIYILYNIILVWFGMSWPTRDQF